jgi:hypothetical protein
MQNEKWAIENRRDPLLFFLFAFFILHSGASPAAPPYRISPSSPETFTDFSRTHEAR